MKHTMYRSFSILLLMLYLAACAGHTGNSEFTPTQAQPDASTGTNASELPLLADLDALEPGSRSASVLGPGWFELWHEDILQHAALTLGSGNAVSLSGGSGSAYGLYCLGGFNSDFSPTSLRLTPSAGTNSGYLLLFADYNTKRWISSGPFNGTTEVQFPGTENGSRHPLDFVSPAGRVYVSVLIDGSDGDLNVDNIELGIHGGVLAPRPPSRLDISLYSDGSVPHWTHSPDYNRPDFAGYVIERQNLLNGTWTEVATAGPLDTSIAIPGLRQASDYRIAAFDVSGNRSTLVYTNETGGALIGSDIMQVRVDMPRGPLVGPVEVTFDMSASSTPGPDPITEYRVLFDDSSLNYTGADPVVTRRLPPGCYLIRFLVNDGAGIGGANGSTTRQLIVYPDWEADDIIVREPVVSATANSFNAINGGIDPLSGDFVVYCEDVTLPGIAIRRGQPGAYHIDSVPLINGTVASFTDPAFHDGVCYFGVKPNSGSPYLVSSGPDGSHITSGSFSYSWMLPVSTGTDLYLVFVASSSVRIVNLLDGSGPLTVAGPLTGISMIDAAWNPVTGLIEVMFDDSGFLTYVGWDPVDGIARDDDSALLDLISGGIDIEIDPATGNSCVLTRSGVQNYYLTKGSSTFSASHQIDSGSSSYWPADVKFLDGIPYSAFASGAGEVKLYELGESAASVVNTASYTTDGFYSGCLVNDGGGGLVLYDEVVDSQLYVTRMGIDDSETELEHLYANQGWGLRMDSALGSAGMHLLMTDYLLGSASHMFSSDGESWIETDSLPGASYADLFDNRAGEVFRSVRTAAGHNVSYWDGAGWVNSFSVPGSQVREPITAGNRAVSSTGWLVQDSTTADMVRAIGNAGGFTMGTLSFPDPQTILGGKLVYDNSTGLQPAFVLYANPGLFQSFGLLNAFDASIQHIFGFNDDSTVVSDYGAFDSIQTRGRTMEVMPFRSRLDQISPVSQACWTVNGHDGSAARYTFRLVDGTPQESLLTDLPFRNADWHSTEVRRTVSAARANGNTAVAVMCSLEGKNCYMEWSRFGDWEQLALPAGIERPADAELLVDTDGRWYIFWRDTVSGAVLCRRTLP